MLCHVICSAQEPVFEVGYSSPLPLNEYFEIIERHFEVVINQSTYVYTNTARRNWVCAGCAGVCRGVCGVCRSVQGCAGVCAGSVRGVQ